MSSPAACFFPSGDAADDYTPCNALASNSACCLPTDTCLDNGYCLGSSGTTANAVFRGACTDARWLDQSCPQQCRRINADAADVLVLFHYNDDEPSTYCCSGGYDSTSQVCKDVMASGGNVPFEMTNALLVRNRTDGSTKSVVVPPAGATVTVTATATATASLNTTLPATGAAAGQAAAVGAGVGVPLAALLLGAGFMWWMERRKRAHFQRMLAEQHATMMVALEAQRRQLATPMSPASGLHEMPDKPLVELHGRELRR